jgi:hypothetical protein
MARDRTLPARATKLWLACRKPRSELRQHTAFGSQQEVRITSTITTATGVRVAARQRQRTSAVAADADRYSSRRTSGLLAGYYTDLGGENWDEVRDPSSSYRLAARNG